MKEKILKFLGIPLLVFLASDLGLILFFSQQSGHILWENILASTIFAAVLAFFILLCLASKWVFFLWLGGTFVIFLITYMAGWESFSIDYFRSDTYSPCPVSFYCFDSQAFGPAYLFLSIGFQLLFLADLVVGAVFGVKILVTLARVYPQTLYYLGAFLFAFFTSMLFAVQSIEDVPTYNTLQYGVLGFGAIMTVASCTFGIFYRIIPLEKFKKIYGAGVISFLLALPIVIPFTINSAAEEKEALIFRIVFGCLTILSFIYFGFFAKPRSTQPLSSSLSVGRTKNIRSRH